MGAGPAGCATALALAPRHNVVLLDVEPAPRQRPGEALAPSVTPLLQRLGIYDAFLATRPLAASGTLARWGSATPGGVDFIADPDGSGWHIDRARFEAMLRSEAGHRGVHQLAPATLLRAEPDDAGWRLTLAPNDAASPVVEARLLVDATGRASAVARQLGAKRVELDHLVAIGGVLEALPTDRDRRTLVEATPDGWWYSALLPDQRWAASFMTDPDLPAARLLRRPDAWQPALAAAPATAERLAGRPFLSPPRPAAAGSAALSPLTGPAWLAVGDAALSFDPLSSHGIGSALAAGLAAAAAIEAQLAGAPDALGIYRELQHRAFERYLWLWRAYYAEEQRWPHAPFWSRRHHPPTAIPPSS